MYLVDDPIAINWALVLNAIDTTVSQDYFDVIVTLSNGASTYYVNPTTGWIQPVFTEDSKITGNITYTITSANPGIHTVQLVTGSNLSYQVLDTVELSIKCLPAEYESEITVCGIDVNNPLVYCVMPTPQFTKSSSDIDWSVIDGIHEDPANPGIIAIAGKREAADIAATVQLYDTSDDTFTNYTLPFLNVGGLAMSPSGRIYVLRADPDAGNQYECFYSDPPYTTWLTPTRPTTQFAGNLAIKYDAYLDKIWWLLGTKVLVTEGGGDTFVQQNRDYLGVETPVSGVSTFRRFVIDGTNYMYLGGNQEFFYSQASSQTPGAVPWPDVKSPVVSPLRATHLAINPDGSALYAASNSGVMKKTTDGVTWTDPLFNLETVTGLATVTHFFTLGAFNKMYTWGIVSGGAREIWESDDGETWALSTDARLTPYKEMASNAVYNDQHYAHLSNTGLAWIHKISPFNSTLIYTSFEP